MNATVAVIGGGYGGATVAKALDGVADVVLVEPKQAFSHTSGAPRALTTPDWMPSTFLPYDRLLTNGRIVHDRAAAVESGRVTLDSGQTLDADYIVLATGSRYPFPAKSNITDTGQAMDAYRHAHKHLADAASVLLLGASPVGLELAGEIRAAWPDKAITLVDPAPEVLGAFHPDLGAEITRQIDAMGVRLLLGQSLAGEPGTPPGILEGFTARTSAGEEIRADLWFRTHGAAPVSDYLTGTLTDARLPRGTVRVEPNLQVAGHETVFAVGDITDVPEPNRGDPATRHAEVVAANIAALITDGDLTGYELGPPRALVPLGPAGGASHLPGTGLIGAQETARYKGEDLMVGRFRELFNLPAPT